MIWSKPAHIPCSLDPVSPYIASGENWSKRPTPTQGQLEITDHLQELGVAEKRVLHIGIGCSHVGRKFLPKAAVVHGVTINPDEKVLADSYKKLWNYHVSVGDKHTSDVYADFWPQTYDWIIDNALTSYACCAWHLVNLLEILTSRLAPGGTLWTHKEALGIHVNEQYELGERPYPPMDLSELERIEESQPLTCETIGGIIAIQRRDR